MQITRKTIDKIIAWAYTSDDTGLSSDSIVIEALGMKRTGTWAGIHYPCDPSDFGRCYRLLKKIPELRALAFPKLARKSKSWAALIRHWGELTREFEFERSLGSSAPHTYECMQALIEENR